MTALPHRIDVHRLPHRAGPRDMGAAAGAASLAGTIALMSMLSAASGPTPDPVPARSLVTPATAA